MYGLASIAHIPAFVQKWKSPDPASAPNRRVLLRFRGAHCWAWIRPAEERPQQRPRHPPERPAPAPIALPTPPQFILVRLDSLLHPIFRREVRSGEPESRRYPRRQAQCQQPAGHRGGESRAIGVDVMNRAVSEEHFQELVELAIGCRLATTPVDDRVWGQLGNDVTSSANKTGTPLRGRHLGLPSGPGTVLLHQNFSTSYRHGAFQRTRGWLDSPRLTCRYSCHWPSQIGVDHVPYPFEAVRFHTD